MAEKDKTAVFGFPETFDQATALAQKLKAPVHHVEVHTFPDLETRVRIPAAANHAVLYRSLDHPNPKIFEVVQAASALRDLGAEKITLVCPYLPYMRQDKVFHKGEAFSQMLFGKIITPWVDAIIAVEPHLHRTRTMADVFPTLEAVALSGGDIMADYFHRKRIDKDTLVLGPDEEAWHTAKPFAEKLNLEWATAVKKRKGDRDVEVDIENAGVEGRPVIIVDDVISSGMTVFEAAKKAYDMGASTVEVAAVHALVDSQTLAAFEQAGVVWVVSCDGVPHETNKIPLAPALAKALKG